MIRFVLFFLLASYSYTVNAHGTDCDLVLQPVVRLSTAGLESSSVDLLKIYKEYRKTTKTPVITNAEILPILESDLDSYKDDLSRLFVELKDKPDEAASLKYLKSFFAYQLKKNQFNTNEAKERLIAWNDSESRDLFQVMGRRSLSDVQKFYFGGDINKIDPHSLIGQYLLKTKAKTKWIRYPEVQGSRKKGPKKLVIAVSHSSFEEFKKILETPYYFTVVGHANMIRNGKFVTYGGGPFQEIREPALNTPFPFTLLSSSESERLERYLDLTKTHLGWYDALKCPWRLPGYCRSGGYNCCTHWIGNIPIGDQLVKKYSFPGNEYDANTKTIMTLLKPYNINNETKEFKKIWKAPGHAQLSEVLGQLEANKRGEFASPGWVIQTLLGATSSERVPVIFWFAEDHTFDIPDSPNFNYENPR